MFNSQPECYRYAYRVSSCVHLGSAFAEARIISQEKNDRPSFHGHLEQTA